MPVQYTPFRGTTDEEAMEHHAKRPKSPDLLLCQNCGFTADNASHGGYISTIKLIAHGGLRGVWAIGDKYILKEMAIDDNRFGDRYLGPEYPITHFLEENSTIPVAKNMKHWSDSTSNFFLMDRVPGESLLKLGAQLVWEEVVVLADEVADCLVQLRKFTSDKLEAPDGSLIRDTTFGPQRALHFWTSDVDEWWARVEPSIQDKSRKDRLMEQYSLHIKPGGPFVLTHGDLNMQNIMVKDKHLSGIIDWERGGYLPEWWELYELDTIENGQWAGAVRTALARKNVVPSEAAKNFEMVFGSAFEDVTPNIFNESVKFYDRQFHWQCPSYPHYMAEEELFDVKWMGKLKREGIEKMEAEKKAIEDNIKTAEDRAKAAEEKLAENETILAEFNKLSVEERENLKRGK
ncbi:uncharacterized protein Bfra_001454 [Botrytis fragariae]|uniref:Aminoglycoside phosphotransferase domain-containing protein n=1 Tax=Botrytis fragariae TaxID=1964551 RepID=A0A8H6B0T3_9HELO|nr:uncharacterized protein Bfra_001454 [Botrytis fragariae]KAF5877093.1 hypothetical protein Bfra_001454 [Botrytis fragariae]